MVRDFGNQGSQVFMRATHFNSLVYAAPVRSRFDASVFWPMNHVAACQMTAAMTTKISKAEAALMR